MTHGPIINGLTLGRLPLLSKHGFQILSKEHEIAKSKKKWVLFYIV